MTEHRRFKDVYLYNISFQRIVQCGNGDIMTNIECDVGGFKFNKAVHIRCALSGKHYINVKVFSTEIYCRILFMSSIVYIEATTNDT